MQALNDWVGSCGVWLLKCFAHTRIETRVLCGKVFANIFWYLNSKRRRVALTNLRLCFPNLSEEKRVTLARKHYQCLGRAALDHSVLWCGTRDEVEELVKIEGLETVTNLNNRPLILVTPHFVGLDAAIPVLNLYVRGIGLYQVQKNVAWDKAVYEGRTRFGNPILIPKGHSGYNVRYVLRGLKDNMPLYYLPDMDYGRRESIFIKFFGVDAATVPAVSRIARVSKAKVCFCVVEMTETGYTVHVSPIWKDFPTKDLYADTERVQREIERWILKFPEQYLWTHRRFKTRPEGEPPVY